MELMALAFNKLIWWQDYYAEILCYYKENSEFLLVEEGYSNGER